MDASIAKKYLKALEDLLIGDTLSGSEKNILSSILSPYFYKENEMPTLEEAENIKRIYDMYKRQGKIK